MMFDALSLTPTDMVVLSGLAFLAGLVRGFSGFALSAVMMATAVVILPPVELIPVLWALEAVASAMMVRGGLRDADRSIATGLVLGSAFGAPIGWALTVSVSVMTSSMIALALIICLAALQLSRVRFAFLATRPGLYGSGVLAGVVSGLAGIGGMIVALYTLSQDKPARVIRATLVIFLLFTSVVGAITMIAFGVFTWVSILRGVALAAPIAVGVFLGQRLFNPRFEPYYKPTCLTLLIVLASVALIRVSL